LHWIITAILALPSFAFVQHVFSLLSQVIGRHIAKGKVFVSELLPDYKPLDSLYDEVYLQRFGKRE
jgi:hypothetical protein